MPDEREACDDLHLLDEEDMPWTQTARDRRGLEDEIRQHLEACRQELKKAADHNRREAQVRFEAGLKAFNDLVGGSAGETGLGTLTKPDQP